MFFLKKVFQVILITCLLFVPVRIRAFQIDTITTKGVGTAKSGDQITINIQAPTSGNLPNEGIGVVYGVINYDSNYLTLMEASSPGYDNILQQSENITGFISAVKENSNVNGTCVDGTLRCGTYTLNLKFQVKDSITESVKTAVTISKFVVSTFIGPLNEESDEDDAIETSAKVSPSHVLLLYPKSTPKEETTPTPTPEPTKTPDKQPAKNTTKVDTVTKSNNADLKSLEIKNYAIDFKKDTTDYEITIDNSIASLELNPVVDYTSASFKVTGNESLMDGSTVKVTVTAEDGSTKDYNLHIKKTKSDTTISNKDGKVSDKSKGNFDGMSKTIVTIVGGIFGFFVLIGILCIVNSIRESKKLDKLLKEDK